MTRHAMETAPSIRIVRSAVPEEVEEAIVAALAKTPADRPQIAAQFAEILGMPLGATATRRAMRQTGMRRTPTQATQACVPAQTVPAWRKPSVPVGIASVMLAGAGVGPATPFASFATAPPIGADQ